MADDVTHVVLEHLKRIRASQDRMELDLTDLKVRMSAVGGALAHMATQMAAQGVRLDRFDERLNRIERRLELAEV